MKKRDQKEWPKDKTKWPTQTRREWLKVQAETIGLFNIHKTNTAIKMGVTRAQIYSDIEVIYAGGIDPKRLNHTTMDISNVHQIMKKDLLTELKKCNGSVKATLANSLNNVLEAETNFLERYGFKNITPQITDTKLEVSWGKDPRYEGKDEDEKDNKN